MANQAAFLINGTPSADALGDRLFIALNSQTLTVQLEVSPSPVLSARFEVFDPADSDSPFASKGAPNLTWNENGLPAITLGPAPYGVNDPVTVDMPPIPAPPATGVYSYLIRCTVSTAGDGSPASQNQVYERLVIIQSLSTTPALRKTVPGESVQARARGWSDAINDIVDAAENAVAGVTSVQSLTSASGSFAVLAGTAIGDVVYVSGSNAAAVADNAAVATMPAAAIIVAKPTATTATLAFSGLVGGLSGMTPGAKQYAGAAGALIEAGALPTTPGEVIQQVGVAITSTILLLDPQLMTVL